VAIFLAKVLGVKPEQAEFLTLPGLRASALTLLCSRLTCRCQIMLVKRLSN
jgi:hypothetical protein